MPLLKNRAAVVFFAMARSLKRTQSHSPCVKRSVQDCRPGERVASPVVSKTQMFSLGILACFAESSNGDTNSGSQITNLDLEVLRWCWSSPAVQEGLVPVKMPPAPIIASTTTL